MEFRAPFEESVRGHLEPFHTCLAIGDAVLKTFSQCLLDSIRKQVDWTGRYGGEEFLVVLPETHLDGAVVLADRIRCAVEATAIQTAGQTFRITASFGVSCFSPKTGEAVVSPEALLQEADERLYQAKSQGRNRIEPAG